MNIIQFNTPADFNKWEEQSLLIGNGHMGASFFGGISTEKVTLNEKTLWTGGQSPTRDYNGGNCKSRYEYTHKVRDFLAEGNYNEAVGLLPMLTGENEGNGFGAYQRLCNAYLEFSGIDEKSISEYYRQIDMSNGVYSSCFNCGDVLHSRMGFASYSDNVIVMKLLSLGKSGVSFKLRLGEIHDGGTVAAKENILYYSGLLADNGLRYSAMFRVDGFGGDVISDSNSIVVNGADMVFVYIAAATDYAPIFPNYRSGVNPEKIVRARIKSASEKYIDDVIAEHIEDFGELYNRVKVDLGEENRKVEKFFNFGRYLLISSSREGSLPANLQGVWNESNTPPWCCDYHTNVNLQMNYWHSLNTNLQECFPPLTDFMESMREPGRVTAKEYYGLDTGFVLHTQTNPFGWTAPGWDFYWGWSTAATAWLMQNLWEYYEFTGDTKTLKSRIFPIMTESAEFYSRWLTLDKKHDRLVSSPSYSPEHGSVTNGNVYEQCLIEQFFSDFVKACEVLGVESELYHKVKSQKSLLKPYAVGKDGRLLEWYEQEDADFDNTKVELKHRHISHLLGLYPGKSITKNTPELLNAAVKVMNDRGDESTGWSRAFKACLWARAGDGDRAYKLLSGLIGDCTYANMLSFHPPFQIDGNFGGTAALAEMLLQSHEGYIEVFPAVPKLWKNAAFSGLCARGGFVVSAEMSGGSVSKVEILSKIGGLCRVKINGQIKEIMTKSGEIVYV